VQKKDKNTKLSAKQLGRNQGQQELPHSTFDDLNSWEGDAA
jgi:hypothetical protein